MTIDVKVIADSVSQQTDIRLTTMQLRYPRLIHSEFMTHRMLSRNAGSSRARPIGKVIAEILSDPAEPFEWGSAQKGMQAGAPLTGWRLKATKLAWHAAKRGAIAAARVMMWAGAHKQVANRILEPWSHIEVLVTATDWANFFALRNHPDADPTIRELARAMKFAMDVSLPKVLDVGDWHLPYIYEHELPIYDLEKLRRMSAARCARVSYRLFDGTFANPEADLRLYGQLVENQPVHASPTEHQATPDRVFDDDGWGLVYENPQLHGCLTGWIQHRKLIPGECVDG